MFPLICTNLSKMITTMINIAIIKQPTSAPAMVEMFEFEGLEMLESTATTIREGEWSRGGRLGRGYNLTHWNFYPYITQNERMIHTDLEFRK